MLDLPDQPSALLCSGGVESATLAYLCSRRTRLQPIYVRFGLIWEDVELECLRRYLESIAHPNLLPLAVLLEPVDEIYQDHWSRTGSRTPRAEDPDESVHLPGRNLLLLAKGAVFCSVSQLSTLLLGTLRGNPFPDASAAFFKQMSAAISLAVGVPFAVVAPLREMLKEDVIRLAPEAPLELSFSCIHPHAGLHCGRCNKCAERRHHFRRAAVADRTVYWEDDGFTE
jgi:7-cyano-7-deazaguanine synthase